MNPTSAPGWPGSPARWTSSAKSGVGTSLSSASLVWFTLSHGIINEVYYPRVDQACTRDMGLLVTGSRGFISEEKRHARSRISYIAEGVPAYRLVNGCDLGQYRIEKEVLTDPLRDCLLQDTIFVPLQGTLADYRLYVLLAPHLANCGGGNTAWVGEYKGASMLFAQRAGVALALASSVPWLKLSAGFVGTSDGWQDIMRHKGMTWSYDRAENGNVALTGEIDLRAGGGRFLLALGFGRDSSEAGNRALTSILRGFEQAKKQYVREWQDWQNTLPVVLDRKDDESRIYRASAAVLRVHEAKNFPGGIIASLSIPWGFARGDEDIGGYHLVWPRDLVEAGGALLASGAHDDVIRILHYLQGTQEADGHWPQNMWLDGTSYWDGIQMDETAFPILLVDLARREKLLGPDEAARFWPMVRRAAGFLARNGPATEQDRWEEDSGYSPFTLAVEIAGMLAAAEMAELNGEPSVADYLRETSDAWNASIERWTYVTGTDLAKQAGVDGYYVRIAPPEAAEAASPMTGFVQIKNRPGGQSAAPVARIISTDALALVRFGLRSAADPRIVNTIKVIDSLLKVDTPSGPCWHRYNDDGYGEHPDGQPFDGTGIGRLWPLLTGERAHYELAAGRFPQAEHLGRALASFANDGGMISEQVWDGPDIPARELYFGRPSGSAMPLVWAHAEYIKLLRSLRDGCVFDMPLQTVERYQKERTACPLTIWRFNHKCREIPAGRVLRLELLAPARVRWSADEWRSIHDQDTVDTGLGVHFVDLPTKGLDPGSVICLTFFWTASGQWEGSDYEVVVASAEEPRSG
ncbi:MAG TPA: glucan 1,4-alpha-glucosidase [Syntrophales bacterium]|nr:glucan 1,4-alpha-glucosidase [Syntrophales bacterium]HRT60795.1 glucan 1,4-alpha-glucosidase [Syntrophales bacterium]